MLPTMALFIPVKAAFVGRDISNTTTALRSAHLELVIVDDVLYDVLNEQDDRHTGRQLIVHGQSSLYTVVAQILE
jgi:hypothetical protein